MSCMGPMLSPRLHNKVEFLHQIDMGHTVCMYLLTFLLTLALSWIDRANDYAQWTQSGRTFTYRMYSTLLCRCWCPRLLCLCDYHWEEKKEGGKEGQLLAASTQTEFIYYTWRQFLLNLRATVHAKRYNTVNAKYPSPFLNNTQWFIIAFGALVVYVLSFASIQYFCV